MARGRCRRTKPFSGAGAITCRFFRLTENSKRFLTFRGAVAQLGEHLLCKQGVTGSIPVSSTKFPERTVRGQADELRTDEPSHG
jgi:hypothetical protein